MQYGIFMDELETKFLQSQSLKPFVWFRYIGDIFFIGIHGQDKLEKFLGDLNSFDNNIKFTHKSSKENVTFLDLIVKLSKGRLILIYISKIQIDTNIFTLIPLMQTIPKDRLSTAKR